MPAEIPRLRAADSIAEGVAALDAHGAVIVEGLLDADLLARFNTELDPLLASARPDRQFLNPAIEWIFGKQARQVAAVAAQSRVFATVDLRDPVELLAEGRR
ncbi:MAG: hypothetical protein ACRD2A_11895 [Vicinamibacterales bacterium]